MSRTAVLTDEMWARIEPVLPALKGPMGRPMKDHRLLVEGAIYRYRTGIPWRDLPDEFGAVADRVEAASPVQPGRHLGHGSPRPAGAGGRRR